MWRGWTAPENADAYQRFLVDHLFPAMREIEGFRGADVLRRDDGNEVAFVTLTRFDSLDAIKAFAGEGYEQPVLEPRALELLSRYDGRAEHFDTAPFLWPRQPMTAMPSHHWSWPPASPGISNSRLARLWPAR
jgi:antibiotic biosynthesis monooxygenase